MLYFPAILNHLRETITTLHPCGLSQIWMKVKSNDDCGMSSVLGYNSDDLNSMLLATTMMKAGLVINKSDKWATIRGVGIEWRDFGRELWCRFLDPLSNSGNLQSSPAEVHCSKNGFRSVVKYPS